MEELGLTPQAADPAAWGLNPPLGVVTTSHSRLGLSLLLLAVLRSSLPPLLPGSIIAWLCGQQLSLVVALRLPFSMPLLRLLHPRCARSVRAYSTCQYLTCSTCSYAKFTMLVTIDDYYCSCTTHIIFGLLKLFQGANLHC